MDRGMVSEENLKYLRERGGQYIVGTPKQMLRAFEQHLTEQDWTQAQEGVEVKLVPAPDGDETFILARSADRRAKELAMHDKFTTRLEAGLKKMRAAAEAGRLKDEAAAGERLGRLKQQNWRASHAFDVTIQKLATPRGKQQLEITWQANAKFGDWSQLADGCYLLRSNLTDVDAATLWRRYIQLTEAEWAFRRPRCARCPQGRAIDPPDLASQGRPRQGSHPGLLSGVRDVEDAGRLDARGRRGRCPADVALRPGKDQKRRHRPACRNS
jgi:hypothetical protein